VSVIRSKDNERVRQSAKLMAQSRERRRLGLALIEGAHLVEACLDRNRMPRPLIVSESALAVGEIAAIVERSGLEPVVLADTLFGRISDTETPAGIAAIVGIPQVAIDCASSTGCVFLEGIQDAGNVGAILRSAAAFGIPDVLVGPGCADPWSPKALRAGMGGHFCLRIGASADLAAEIRCFGETTLCTVARGGEPMEKIDLTRRTGWIFGNEGAGVSTDVAAAATRRVSIFLPGRTESLNVAAAAAICLYEMHRQVSRRAARS